LVEKAEKGLIVGARMYQAPAANLAFGPEASPSDKKPPQGAAARAQGHNNKSADLGVILAPGGQFWARGAI
jgi:hypothetical protein